MKTPKDKVTLLSEARKKREEKQVAVRNSILLSKAERREVQGFKARQREIDTIQNPLNSDYREFLAELQTKYSITIGVTHQLDIDSYELVPMPEQPKTPETA